MRNEEDIKKEEVRKGKKNTGSGINLLLHLVQHISIVMAVILAATVLLGSFLRIEGSNGPQMYNLMEEEAGTDYTDSLLFNRLLGNSIADVIRLGVIKGQMETDGKFDAKKVVDVTAYAGRYSIMEPEYITAQYYLDDLINWSKNGFEFKDSYLTGEEADEFLSRFSIVTALDNDVNCGNGENINIYYLSSDLDRMTKVRDVSGNQFESGEYQREDVNATIMKNRYRTVEGKNIENHVSSWEEYYELCQNITKAADDLAINYDEYLKYQDLLLPEQTNIVYFIRKTIGNETQVYTNMDVKSKELKTLKNELLDLCSRSVYYDPSGMSFETDTRIVESTLRHILNGFEYAYPENTQVMVGVRKDLSHVHDSFAEAADGFNRYAPYSAQYLIAAVACMVLYLLLLVILTIREGVVGKRESGEIVIRLHREDRIPTEIMAVALGVVSIGLYWLIKEIINTMWQEVSENTMIIFAGASALAVSLLFSFFYYSLVRRIKAHNLWKDSLVRNLGVLTVKGIRYAYLHWDVMMRIGVPFGLWVLFHAVMIVLGNLAGKRSTGRLVLILFIVLAADALIGILLYRSARARERILECIRKINEGDLEHKVKEDGMHGDNLVMARAVNSIGDSVKNAVETSMKDERLKADLITNVSHDIKTPLTSIINYVDLIKRQNVQDPKISEYIQVLDEKSQRLKQLTDDLVEASKISSGNIVLQWEKINLVELLNQTLGEFSEKFREKALYPVINAPDSPVYIHADSRRIWRVMENLFNNIFKYALEGTRVYIDMGLKKAETKEAWVKLSIKNISANPLKVNPEELTERFIRGDESRTTEGSGLGLSIAKNLVEIQNGTFEIVMDGDLFKVNLTFPLLEAESAV